MNGGSAHNGSQSEDDDTHLSNGLTHSRENGGKAPPHQSMTATNLNGHTSQLHDEPTGATGLQWPGKGTIDRKAEGDDSQEGQERLDRLSGAVRTMLECVGEDPDREGLLKTPERYAKALLFLTRGYQQSLEEVVNDALFREDHGGLVVVRDIEINSLCEHHLVPFTGKIHIGYVPSVKVIGLSKLARIADMFARRLQVQERITRQVAETLEQVLQPKGVAVVVESTHLCMVMRGAQKKGAVTTTSCMTGCMKTSAEARNEFYRLLGTS